MPTTVSKEKTEQRISVRKTKGSDVMIGIRIHFDPKVIGEEKAQQVWDAVGNLLAGVLTEKERALFLERLAVERRKLAKGGRI